MGDTAHAPRSRVTALLPPTDAGEPRPGVVAGGIADDVADLIDLRLTSGPTGPVLSVRGELDTHTSRALRAGLAAAGPDGAEVVIDLSGVTFADSATLGVLVAEHKRLTAAGRTLVLSSPGPAVRRVLELSGLLRVLDVRAGAQSS
jgi:anti-sigma B factor antagonist